MLDVQLVAGATQEDRQHARSVYQFLRSVDGEKSNCLRTWMLVFPAAHCAERQVLDRATESIERSFDIIYHQARLGLRLISGL